MSVVSCREVFAVEMFRQFRERGEGVNAVGGQVVDEKPKSDDPRFTKRPVVTPADPPQLSGKRERGMFTR